MVLPVEIAFVGAFVVGSFLSIRAFWLTSTFYKRLQTLHRTVWEDLGRPSLLNFHFRSIKTLTLRTWRNSRGYADLQDPVLESAGDRLMKSTRVTTMFALITLALAAALVIVKPT
jgi:hypothetical protein